MIPGFATIERLARRFCAYWRRKRALARRSLTPACTQCKQRAHVILRYVTSMGTLHVPLCRDDAADWWGRWKHAPAGESLTLYPAPTWWAQNKDTPQAKAMTTVEVDA